MKALSPLTVAVFALAMLALKAATDLLFGEVAHDQIGVDLVTLGCLVAAARAFDPDDPPRRPWTMLAVATGLVTLAHLIFALVFNLYLRHGLILLHNVVWVAALVSFWRVMRSSGLSPGWTRGSALVVIPMVAVSAGVGLWGGWEAVAGYLALDDPAPDRLTEALTNAVGALADATVFIVAVNLARIVWMMRGGALMQPYLLLAVGSASLLVTDIMVLTLRAGSYLALTAGLQYLVALGWSLVAIAALSQRALLHRARELAADELTPLPGTYE